MKKTKLITAMAIATTAILPITTTLTSCNYQAKYSAMVQDLALKLVDMNKRPRCTSIGHKYNLGAIRQWCFNEGIKAGVKPETFGTDTYGNIWMDVEASEGCEEWKPLILQAHMDMVVTGLSEDEKEVTPIDTVIDWKKGEVHSRDYKTTIGADDGDGIAAMFILIQNKEIKHGPLRLFCSADEDSGMIGAAAIYNEYKDVGWNPFKQMGNATTPGKDIKYLLNLDAGEAGEIYSGCAGSETYNFTKEYDISAEAKLTNEFYIDIEGFKGGHSGAEIVLNRANAEKCIGEILYEIINTLGKNVQIVKHYHPKADGTDDSFQRNAIVSHARMVINTDASDTEINSIINSKIEGWKSTYDNEDWTNVKITCNKDTDSELHNKYISTTDSKTVINFVGKNDTPTAGTKVDYLWYGYTSDGVGGYKLNANIAPFEVKLNTETDKYTVKIGSQTRTRTQDYFDIMEACYSELKLDGVGPDESSKSRYIPWEKQENNPMVSIVSKACTDVGITPNEVVTTGGIEPTWWVQCNTSLNCAGTGFTMRNAHAATETLYLDSAQSVFDCLIKVLAAMETAA